MTAPHQDKRVEDLIENGAAKIVDAAFGALPATAAGLPLQAIAQSYRAQAIVTVHGLFLDLLTAVGVDTSAHVRAPEVAVHVHRAPPHEARLREPRSFE